VRNRSLRGGLPRLLRRARPTLLSYCDARERLRRLGVIRTDGALAGQFAEYVACKHLRLCIAPSNVQKAYDATDRRGRTYQIKGRIVSSQRMSTSFDFRRPMHRFDFLLGVLVTGTFDVLAIIRVSHVAVRRHARRNRGRYSLRWTRRSFAAPRVDVLYIRENERAELRSGREPRGPKGK
jgi:hypothetical protein